MPRSRAETLALVDDRDAARRVTGSFLCFLMIPVIERFGQWRFAGAATDLAQALERLEVLMTALADEDLEGEVSLRELVEVEVLDFPASLDESWSAGGITQRELGRVTLEIFAEGGAPHDDIGIAVVSVASLEGHSYATRGVESRPPECTVWPLTPGHDSGQTRQMRIAPDSVGFGTK